MTIPDPSTCVIAEDRHDNLHYSEPVLSDSQDSINPPSQYDFESTAFRTKTFLRVARKSLLWQSLAFVIGVCELLLAALWFPWPHIVGLVFGGFLIVVSTGRIYYLHRTFVSGARPSADSVTRPLLRPAERRFAGHKKAGQRLFDFVQATLMVAALILFIINIVARLTIPPSTFPQSCLSEKSCYRVERNNTMFPSAPPPVEWQNTTIGCAAGLAKRRLRLWMGVLEEMDFVDPEFPAKGYTTAHYVKISTALGVPDDVYVHFKCINGSVELSFHSQSRLGWWDFDDNRRRLLWLADKLRNPKWKPEELEKCVGTPCNSENGNVTPLEMVARK